MALTSRLLGASGVVIVGVVAAAAFGQIPALGAEDHAIVATPASAAQRLVCPGSPVAVGAAGQKASTLSADGSRGAEGRGRRFRPSDHHHARRRRRQGRQRHPSPPRRPRRPRMRSTARSPAPSPRRSRPATRQASRATACTVPVNIAWIAAGATTTGRTSVLTLANASSVPAQVELDVWTENGPVAAAGPGQLLVGAHSRLAVSLASVAPGAAGTALRVVSTGGQLGVALEQRVVRGLESGGLDLTGPTSAPATEQVVTGVRIANSSAVAAASAATGYADLQPVLRLLAPGKQAADVRIAITGTTGSGKRVLTHRIDGGKVTDITLPGLTDGTYSLDVTSSRPIVAGARVATVTDASASTTDTGTATTTAGTAAAGTTTERHHRCDRRQRGRRHLDRHRLRAARHGRQRDECLERHDTSGATTATGRGIDLAWIAAGDPLGSNATVAVARGAGSDALLRQPDGPRGVRAALRRERLGREGSGGWHGRDDREGGDRHDQRRERPSCRGELRRSPTPSAGYPVAPADQAAHPVRVTH